MLNCNILPYILNYDFAMPRGVGVSNVLPSRKRRALYTRGTEVRLLIKELELSKTFLGYDKEMTLMEADAVLLGLHNAPSDAEESTRFHSNRES